MKRLPLVLLTTALLSCLILPVLRVDARDPVAPGPATLPGALDALTGAARRELRRSPIVAVFEACKDAVVNISSTQTVDIHSPWDDVFNLPLRHLKATSLGSGFVIHSSGYIVTNAHVVARTTEHTVSFPDKREYPAQVVAIDQEHDLAVLKIDAPQALKPLKLGRSDDLMVGETVVAIGNPLGYQNTCTAGIVSALDRSIEVGEGLSFTGLIQTDASINPGNSGGPLLNVLGELIGINSAIRGDAQNIGFAIPVDRLRAILPEMLAVERRHRIISGMRLAKDGSTQVVSVTLDSPGAKAGIDVGDVIVSIGGQKVASGIEYWIALIGHKAGDQVPLTIERDGKARDVTLTLGARPKPDGAKLLSQKLGIEAEELTARAAKVLGMAGASGLTVTKTEPGSPAADIHIQRGDVIVRLGRHPAANLDDVGDMLETIPPGQILTISILRVRGPMVIQSSAPIKVR